MLLAYGLHAISRSLNTTLACRGSLVAELDKQCIRLQLLGMDDTNATEPMMREAMDDEKKLEGDRDGSRV